MFTEKIFYKNDWKKNDACIKTANDSEDILG